MSENWEVERAEEFTDGKIATVHGTGTHHTFTSSSGTI